MVGSRVGVWGILVVLGCGPVWAQDAPAQDATVQVADAPVEAAPAPPRTARLTYVAEGVVTVTPVDGSASVAAVENMPLTEGMRLTAADNGQAEVEFEDGSVVRMTPNSAIRLDTLGTDPSGKAATVVRVLGGLVYVEGRASTAGSFRVVAQGDSFWPIVNATVRVNMDEPPAVFSVLDGKIRVQHVAILPSVADPGAQSDNAQSDKAQSINGYLATVRTGESIRSDVTDGTRYFLSDRIAPESWDNWNEGRDQAALDQLATATSVRDNYAGSEGYGWADLDANGTWYDQGDGGPIWQPVEALQVGFDPYGAGNWAYVSGFGYGWASGYRWGWTPFRCGRWWWYDGFGWGWQPDGFCRMRWGYGGHLGGYVARGPKNYAPPILPVHGPVKFHPIVVKGPFDGRHPPYDRPRGPRREPEQRQIAGVPVKPIPFSGHPYTPRGGSAVGSALKRDYAVDTKTKAPDVGAVSTPVPVQTLSSGPGWHAVSTRPDSQPASGGGFRGLFHSSKPQETPVVMDRRGNPVVPEVRREQNRQAEFQNEHRSAPAQSLLPGSTPVRSNVTSAPAQQRVDAPRQNQNQNQAPRMENHSNSYAAPPASAPHYSAPAPAPAPSTPVSAPAAASSHK